MYCYILLAGLKIISKFLPSSFPILFFFLEQSKTDPAEFQSNGITAEGVKYTFLRAQDNMILGKIKLMASYDSLVMINYKNC